MQNHRKRKKLDQPHSSGAKPTKPSIEIGNEPFPNHPRPTLDDCRAVRDDLLALHGFPPEFAKYRRKTPTDDLLPAENGCGVSKVESLEGDEGKESVLDGLVRTVLSQNTTEVNSERAFANLKSAFPAWEDVLEADSKCIENAIRCGGLAPTKASCIKNIMKSLLEKRGKLCLEYLRDLSVGEVKAELSHFKGIGPKTVACVLMFHLQQDDFPVDTHIFEISKTLGWIPIVADRNKAYLHLNQRIPDELKFDLNCLMYTHGKVCRKCYQKGGIKIKKGCHDKSCPLLHYGKNS
ncbi:hypothetical protein UlMin_008056 [Ulmus minor]